MFYSTFTLSSTAAILVILTTLVSASSSSHSNLIRRNHAGSKRSLNYHQHLQSRDSIGTAAILSVVTSNSTTTNLNSTSSTTNSTESFNTTALWYTLEDNTQTACMQNYSSTDFIFALSTAMWNDTGDLSPLCGQSVIVTNPDNGQSVKAIVGDWSGSEFSTLSESAFAAIAPLDQGMALVSYTFPDADASDLPTASNTTSFSNLAAALNPNLSASSSASFSSVAPSSVTPTPAPTPTINTAAVRASKASAAAQASSDAADAAASSSAAADAASSSSAAAAAASASSASADSAAASSKAQAKAQAAQAQAAAAPSPTSKPSPTPSPTPSASDNNGGQVFSGGIATFFTQNGVAGACGTVHQDSDFVIAIDSAMYANGANCGRKVQITRTDNGKVGFGVVQDECPTCDNGTSLDLSTGFFNSLGAPSEGIFHMTWKFV